MTQQEQIFQAIVKVCEKKAREGLYKGNSHRLASEIAACITPALMSVECRRVYDMLSLDKGISRNNIAKRLNLNLTTVSHHLQGIYAMGLASFTEAKKGLKLWKRNF